MTSLNHRFGEICGAAKKAPLQLRTNAESTIAAAAQVRFVRIVAFRCTLYEGQQGGTNLSIAKYPWTLSQ
ncbi:hypothetical protein ACMAY8_02575 [Rhodobacteraceae bacterium nBUS_22]